MQARAVIFDADGVMLLFEKFTVRLEKEHGIPLEKTLPFIRGVLKPRCLIGEADLKEELSNVYKEWGWKGSLQELIDFWFKGEANVNLEMVEYIRALRKGGVLCFLATNQEKYRHEFMMDELGFAELFDRVFCSCDIGAVKPTKEYLDRVLGMIKEEYDIGIDDMVLWDDRAEHVEGFSNLGVRSFLYTDMGSFRKTMDNVLGSII